VGFFRSAACIMKYGHANARAIEDTEASNIGQSDRRSDFPNYGHRLLLSYRVAVFAAAISGLATGITKRDED
jgi:hypothetical protein